MAADTLHVALVVDMSGSMSSVYHETIAGLDQYISDLKEQEGDTLFSLTAFDTVFEKWYVAEPIRKVQSVRGRYKPRGMTALYDAIANTITETESRLRQQGREQERVLVVVITDGQENSSSEYAVSIRGRERIFELIHSYEAKGNWTFSYIGAAADQYSADLLREQAIASGFSAGNVATSSTGAKGTAGTYSAMSASTGGLRTNSTGSTQSLYADSGIDTNLDNYVLPEDSPYKTSASDDVEKTRRDS